MHPSKTYFQIVTVLTILLPKLALACEPGFQEWHSRETSNVGCIPNIMVSYLMCLEGIAGGKLTVEKTTSKNAGKTIKVKVAGQGNGLIVAGSGEVNVDTSNADAALEQLKQTFPPNGSNNCLAIAIGGRPDNLQRKPLERLQRGNPKTAKPESNNSSSRNNRPQVNPVINQIINSPQFKLDLSYCTVNTQQSCNGKLNPLGSIKCGTVYTGKYEDFSKVFKFSGTVRENGEFQDFKPYSNANIQNNELTLWGHVFRFDKNGDVYDDDCGKVGRLYF